MNLPTVWWPVRRLLERHLGRLRDNLEALADRLRESLASTIGKTVADAVHEVLERLLTLPYVKDAGRTRRYHDPWRYDTDEEAWEDDNDEPWQRGRQRSDPEDDTPESTNEGPTRWQRALAIGLQAASWLLRRQFTTVPLASALGLGMLATAASVARGPTVITVGAGIVAAVLGLLNLVEAATATVDLAS